MAMIIEVDVFHDGTGIKALAQKYAPDGSFYSRRILPAEEINRLLGYECMAKCGNCLICTMKKAKQRYDDDPAAGDRRPELLDQIRAKARDKASILDHDVMITDSADVERIEDGESVGYWVDAAIWVDGDDNEG